MTEQFIKGILAEELLGTRLCESIEDQEILDTFYDGLKPLLEKFLWGEPISVPELRKLLRKNIVNFEFIKLDGKVRPARGTTMMKYVPKADQPKGIRPSSDSVATFYDLQKDAWRSVSKKSKEIVLKKDEKKNRPIVVVKDKDEDLKKKGGKTIAKLGPEPEDRLQVGDIRNYLNRNGKNIIVKITRLDDDGAVYAETFREKTPFKIPTHKVQNLGEIVTPEELQKLTKPRVRGPIVPPTPMVKPREPNPEPEVMKPVTPETPDGVIGPEEEVIELQPVEDTEAKEIPPVVDDEEDAEELVK
jgi:hypothetical protein